MNNNISSDGVGITIDDASSAIFNKTLFEGNTDIEYFDEFSKFTAMGSRTAWVNTGNYNRNEAYSFKNCINLKSIDLSSQTVDLPLHAFEGCTSLVTVNRLSSLCTVLHNDAFKNCSSLTSIDLSHVETILQNVFDGCRSLSNVIWPSKFSSMSSGAFRNCTSLTGNIDITLENSTKVPVEAFHNTAIKKLIVRAPNATTCHTPSSYYISAYIGSNVKVINLRHTGVIQDAVTFRNNSNLIVAITPETSGGYGFEWDFIGNCPNIKYLIIMANSLIDTNSDGFPYMFRGTNGPNVNIYVKDNLLDTYLNHSKLDSGNNQVGWSKYASRIKPISELPTDEYIDGLSIAELVDE